MYTYTHHPGRCIGGVTLGLPTSGGCLPLVYNSGLGPSLRSPIGTGLDTIWPAERRHGHWCKMIREEEKTYSIGGCGVFSTEVPTTRRRRVQVGRCCYCSRRYTCLTYGVSGCAQKYRNASWRCSSCTYWRVFHNKVVSLHIPAPKQGILIHFASGVT